MNSIGQILAANRFHTIPANETDAFDSWHTYQSCLRFLARCTFCQSWGHPPVVPGTVSFPRRRSADARPVPSTWFLRIASTSSLGRWDYESRWSPVALYLPRLWTLCIPRNTTKVKSLGLSKTNRRIAKRRRLQHRCDPKNLTLNGASLVDKWL